MRGNEKQMGLVTLTGHLSPDGQKLIATNAFVNIIKAFNVKYLLSIWPLENPDLEMIGKPSGIYLFLNKKVLPRAFLAPGAVHLDDDTASQALINGQIDLQEKVIIADSNTLSSTEDYSGLDMGQVYITSYSAERIELEANIMHDCWLVLSDSYYQGWRVTIDDQETKIFRANLCSRAIPIKEGSHKIVFFFQPQSFQHGGVISIVSLIIAILVIAIDARRKKGVRGSSL